MQKVPAVHARARIANCTAQAAACSGVLWWVAVFAKAVRGAARCNGLTPCDAGSHGRGATTATNGLLPERAGVLHPSVLHALWCLVARGIGCISLRVLVGIGGIGALSCTWCAGSVSKNCKDHCIRPFDVGGVWGYWGGRGEWFIILRCNPTQLARPPGGVEVRFLEFYQAAAPL